VPSNGPVGRAKPKLLEQLAHAVRTRRYSPRTEEAYRSWVRRFVRYSGMRHPDELGTDEVNSFLSYLAVERRVSASTQSQARAALLFLYKEVLRRPLVGVEGDVVRGKKPSRLPTVLTRGETRAVLRQMKGTQQLVASVLYGSGLRLAEGLQLRVKDLELERRELRIWGCQGGSGACVGAAGGPRRRAQ
jgi:site-specific recombinase XerD